MVAIQQLVLALNISMSHHKRSAIRSMLRITEMAAARESDIASRQISKGTTAIEITDNFDIDGNKYTCKVCRSDFQGRKQAQDHFGLAHTVLRGTRAESNWRSLFSAAGECSLCDYKFKPRTDRKASQERVFFCSLRHHIDVHHPGKRKEMIKSALEKAVETTQDAAPADSSSNLNHHPESAINSYSCNECSQIFASSTLLLTHSISAHHRQSQECSECREVFTSAQELSKHRQDRHTHRCYYCLLSFECEADNIAHMQHCSDSTDSEGLVIVGKIEIADHFDIDGDKHTCKICGLDYFGQVKAQSHFKSVHDALHGKRMETQLAWRSLFSAAGECSLCNYKYSPKSAVKTKKKQCQNLLRLRKHLETSHPGKCEEMVAAALNEATKLFQDAALVFAAGTLNRLPLEVPKEGYSCADCGQTFPSSTECLKHRNTAHPRQQKSLSVQCSLCGKVLSSTYRLRHHMNIFHASRCRYCSQCFERDADANLHMQHCIQRPQKNEFECPQCDKTFNAERLLKAHLAMKHNPAQQGHPTAQIDVVKKENDNGSKRRKLTNQVPLSSVSSSLTNDETDDMACGRGIALSKQEDTDVISDMHDMISFAIVKEEYE